MGYGVACLLAVGMVLPLFPFSPEQTCRLALVLAESVSLGQAVQAQAVQLPVVLRSLLAAPDCQENAPRIAWQVLPEGIDEAQVAPVLLFCVHGTWSSPAEFGQNCYTQGTYYMRQTAMQLAYVLQRPVLLFSFTWSGALDQQQRTLAGNQLACAIGHMRFLYQPWQCWVLGHSHGCNVIAQALNMLQQEGQEALDVVVYAAAPAIEEERVPLTSDALGAKQLYCFYAAADVTALLGSFEVQCTFEQRLGSFFYQHHGVYFALIRCGARHLNHVNVKTVVWAHLLKLIASCLQATPLRDLLIDVPYPGGTSISGDSFLVMVPDDSVINAPLTPLPVQAVVSYNSMLFAQQHGVDVGQRPDCCNMVFCAPFAEVWQALHDIQSADELAARAVPCRLQERVAHDVQRVWHEQSLGMGIW